MKVIHVMFARPADRSHLHWSWLLIIVLGLSMACGDSSGDTPRFEDAEELDSADVPEDDLDDLGFEVSDAHGAVYRTEEDLETVYEYYADGVEDDDWQVEETIPDETEAIVILSKDDTVATVFVMPGYRAIEGQALFEQEGLDLDPDDVADDDTVILISQFTCEEDDVDDCLNAISRP